MNLSFSKIPLKWELWDESERTKTGYAIITSNLGKPKSTRENAIYLADIRKLNPEPAIGKPERNIIFGTEPPEYLWIGNISGIKIAWRIVLNWFYEASITLIAKPDRYHKKRKEKKEINRYKNP